jgi:hypothetical protein
LDEAPAVRGAGVQFVQGTVVPAPGVEILQQIGPNLLVGQELNGALVVQIELLK